MLEEISILIVDDHPVFRRGLREILDMEPDFRIIGEAGDGEAALELMRNRKPRVAVIDIEMPKLTGLELADCVQREKIPVKLLVLTMYQEESIFDRAMDLGVMGYLVKDSADDDIVHAIRAVARGDYFISPILVSNALKKRRPVSATDTALQIGQLTLTERYVLREIALSRSSKQIAERLSVSTRTVERHRYNVCQKLHLSGSYSLIRFAVEHRQQLEENV
jgi:DNA-binding NarL/FixJ family response regulator